MKTSVPMLLVGVFISLLLLSAVSCAGVQGKQSAPTAQAPTAQAPAKWEYNLGTVTYDKECAAVALAPYKSQLSDLENILGSLASKEAVAMAWQFTATETSEFKYASVPEMLGTYMRCGQAAFDLYAQPMGEQGWEMVSYYRISYTAASFATYVASVSVDYGYEVMWKRRK